MNRIHRLSDQEVEALKQLHGETKDVDIRSRCDMILLSNDGLSPPQIAERVRLSHRTVTRYIQRYEAEGIESLFPHPRPGRPRKVTPEEDMLMGAVAQDPRKMGLPFSNWTTANLAEYMAKWTGIFITLRWVEDYLKAHDWRLRRPVGTVNNKQDADAVAGEKPDPQSDGLGWVQ